MPYFKCPQCQLMLYGAGPYIVSGDCPRCELPMLHVPDEPRADAYHAEADSAEAARAA